ncbi:hypothetical protein FRP1_26415 [Pseudonocardia sp. EC080625-04]|nr:hypothetical protein FRP1_26415 [Pseudonocardia sp. EC080625-04]ALL81933.1 hypothetical protein AD017_13415 [Pseudonocardia sp. EC080619-01]
MKPGRSGSGRRRPGSRTAHWRICCICCTSRTSWPRPWSRTARDRGAPAVSARPRSHRDLGLIGPPARPDQAGPGISEAGSTARSGTDPPASVRCARDAALGSLPTASGAIPQPPVGETCRGPTRADRPPPDPRSAAPGVSDHVAPGTWPADTRSRGSGGARGPLASTAWRDSGQTPLPCSVGAAVGPVRRRFGADRRPSSCSRPAAGRTPAHSHTPRRSTISQSKAQQLRGPAAPQPAARSPAVPQPAVSSQQSQGLAVPGPRATAAPTDPPPRALTGLPDTQSRRR